MEVERESGLKSKQAFCFWPQSLSRGDNKIQGTRYFCTCQPHSDQTEGFTLVPSLSGAVSCTCIFRGEVLGTQGALRRTMKEFKNSLEPTARE